MKKKMVLLSFIGCAVALAWALYPTDIPTDSYSTQRLSKDQFVQIKKLLLDYAEKNSALGVEVKGNAGEAGTLSISCRNVPMVFLFDFPQATSMMFSEGAFERSPGLEAAVKAALLKMKNGGNVEFTRGAGNINELDVFFLKYRDGIDMGAECT